MSDKQQQAEAASSAAPRAATRLKFQEISPHFEVTFWYALEHEKLHKWKLEEPTAPIRIYIPSGARGSNQLSQVATLCDDGFREPCVPHANCHTIPASLINFNTIQQLTELDKKIALQQAAATNDIVSTIRSGSWDTESLLRGAVFTFADLKSHEFHYCMGFPAIDLGSPVTLASRADAGNAFKSSEALAAASSHMFGEGAADGIPFLVDPATGSTRPFNASGLSSMTEPLVAFYDTSRLPDFPCWGLRNIIAAIRLTFPERTGATRVVLLVVQRGGVHQCDEHLLLSWNRSGRHLLCGERARCHHQLRL